MMIARVSLLIVLVMALAACNRDVGFTRNADGTATITVSLQESEINTIIRNALDNASDPLLRDVSVDLQNGQIVVSGVRDREDGNGTVSGNFTLAVSASNGAVDVQITDVNIEGWNASDERIQEFNEELERRLGGRSTRDNANATLDRITVTENALEFVLTVELQRQN